MESDPTETVEEPTSTPITHPRDGLGHVIETDEALSEAIKLLASGTGPVALDAERASGFRYSQRAYLIQLRRVGSGTHLIDPTGITRMADLQTALDGVDWILHAASQDLVCLADAGLVPTANLFDTELAGRILGFPKVSLGTLIESELGFLLAKEHSAADWSTRPLPESWLVYAALDVEFLLELWDAMRTALEEAGKYEWALQEFEHVRITTKPIERLDPWRRTSGMHALKKSAELAIVRQLWLARNELAREIDLAPGRLMPDSSIVSIATDAHEYADKLHELPALRTRQVKKYSENWITATRVALELPTSEYPTPKLSQDGPPAPRNWQMRNPAAWKRLEYARAVISALAEEINVPQENLITPDAVRRILWEPPATPAQLEEQLIEMQVRPWQRLNVGPILQEAIWPSTR